MKKNNTIETARVEIRIKNILKEINELVDQFASTTNDETRENIKEKIDFKFDEIEELKKLL